VLHSAALRCSVFGAAALIAGALGDCSVERIADTGVFGARYVDHDQSAVGATIVLGLGLAFAVAVLRLGALLGAVDARRRAAWRRASARLFAPRAVLRAMPLVLTLQCATVFAIESAERIALGAPPPHGLLWLGAPVLISLTFHLAIGLVCALALTAALRALLGWCAALVAGVLDVVLATLAGPPRPCLAARAEAPLLVARGHRARQRGERAPPLLTTLA
jgi:hypothetical protein